MVDGPHDPFRVAAVVGPAVDGEREVDGVADAAPDAVGPGRIDGRVLVEGVGVVAPPLPVGADDVDEAGAVLVRPHLGVEADGQDGEDPLVTLEHAGLVEGDVGQMEPALEAPSSSISSWKTAAVKGAAVSRSRTGRSGTERSGTASVGDWGPGGSGAGTVVAQRSTPRMSPLVGTPVPAVTTMCSSPEIWLTAVVRTWRTPSAMPLMPWM